MQLSFKGKIVLITGGSSGIGAAITRLFAQTGAAVVIADVNPKGEELAEQVRASGYPALFVATDVSRLSDTQQMVQSAVSQFGGIDILINCAGIFPRGTIEETTVEQWDKVMDINLKGAFQTCQSVIPALIERGGGSILNIGSLTSYGGGPGLFAYSISKGGLMTMTTNLARGLAQHKIRVNSVHPGWVATEGEHVVQKKEGRPDNWVETEAHRIPLGRIQRPEDIAPTVIYLSSEYANLITGQFIAVDGGLGL